jgi:hypothetical protein
MDFFICGSREKTRFRTDAANKKMGAQRLTFLFESPQIRINGVNPAGLVLLDVGCGALGVVP